MVNKKLVQYIRGQLEAGVKRQEVERVLLEKGVARAAGKKGLGRSYRA